MFVVNQSGTECVKLETVNYSIGYTDYDDHQCEMIRLKCIRNTEVFGSDDDAKAEAEKQVDKYLSCRKKLGMIYINGKPFATFDNSSIAKKVFDKLMFKIDTGADLFDLRKYPEDYNE